MTPTLLPASTLALIGPIGTWEALVILVVGLLIFGRRLPEVGKSLGKGIVEFRKGLQGIEREVDDATTRPATTPAASLPPQSTDPDRVPVTRTPMNAVGGMDAGDPAVEGAGKADAR